MSDHERNTIWVQPGPNARNRVALWERDSDHPNGEIYIAGPRDHEEPAAVEVAETPGVLGALRDRRLIQIKQPRNAAQLRQQAEQASHATPEINTGEGQEASLAQGRSGATKKPESGSPQK